MAVASITADAIAIGPAILPAILKKFAPLAAVPAPWPSTLRGFVKELPLPALWCVFPDRRARFLAKVPPQAASLFSSHRLQHPEEC